MLVVKGDLHANVGQERNRNMSITKIIDNSKHMFDTTKEKEIRMY